LVCWSGKEVSKCLKKISRKESQAVSVSSSSLITFQLTEDKAVLNLSIFLSLNLRLASGQILAESIKILGFLVLKFRY